MRTTAKAHPMSRSAYRKVRAASTARTTPQAIGPSERGDSWCGSGGCEVVYRTKSPSHGSWMRPRRTNAPRVPGGKGHDRVPGPPYRRQDHGQERRVPVVVLPEHPNVREIRISSSVQGATGPLVHAKICPDHVGRVLLPEKVEADADPD